jgi:hypothetical protein
MSILSHTKCEKCGKKANVSDFKENDLGIGSICKNTDACKDRENKNKITSEK